MRGVSVMSGLLLANRHKWSGVRYFYNTGQLCAVKHTGVIESGP